MSCCLREEASYLIRMRRCVAKTIADMESQLPLVSKQRKIPSQTAEELADFIVYGRLFWPDPDCSSEGHLATHVLVLKCNRV